MLKKARAGKDPFIEPPRPRRKATDAEDLDPDLETVGRVLEGSKLYVISALFIISSSCSLVFAKVMLSILEQTNMPNVGASQDLHGAYGACSNSCCHREQQSDMRNCELVLLHLCMV